MESSLDAIGYVDLTRAKKVAPLGGGAMQTYYDLNYDQMMLKGLISVTQIEGGRSG